MFYFSKEVYLKEKKKIRCTSFLLQRKEKKKSAFRTSCLPGKGEHCDIICKMHGIFCNKEKKESQIVEHTVTTITLVREYQV